MLPNHVDFSLWHSEYYCWLKPWTWWCKSITLICSWFCGLGIWTRQRRDSFLFHDDWGLSWGDLTGWGWLEHLGGWTAGAGSWLASMLISFLACLMLRLKDRLLTSTPTRGLPIWQGLPTEWWLGSKKMYIENKHSKSKFKIVSGNWTTSSEPALVVT